MFGWYVKKRMRALGARIGLTPVDYPALRRPASGEGAYLEVGLLTLYYVEMERGKEIARVKYDSSDDALYAIFKDITFTKAATSKQAKQAPAEQYLQCVYDNQIELLSRIDEKFAKRRKGELSADYFTNRSKH